MKELGSSDKKNALSLNKQKEGIRNKIKLEQKDAYLSGWKEDDDLVIQKIQ